MDDVVAYVHSLKNKVRSTGLIRPQYILGPAGTMELCDLPSPLARPECRLDRSDTPILTAVIQIINSRNQPHAAARLILPATETARRGTQDRGVIASVDPSPLQSQRRAAPGKQNSLRSRSS